MESFRWMQAPEFKVENVGKNKIRVKGVAVNRDQVSRNKKKYGGGELEKSARTWIGKHVTINHAPWNPADTFYNSRKVVGDVKWSEYEDDQVEYIAEINKQPYVDMLRNGSTEIRGVSIEADYLYNRCSHWKKLLF